MERKTEPLWRFYLPLPSLRNAVFYSRKALWLLVQPTCVPNSQMLQTQHVYLRHWHSCTRAQRKPSLRTTKTHVPRLKRLVRNSDMSRRHRPTRFYLFFFFFFFFFAINKARKSFSPTEMTESLQCIFYPTSGFGWEDLGRYGLLFIHIHISPTREGRYGADNGSKIAVKW